MSIVSNLNHKYEINTDDTTASTNLNHKYEINPDNTPLLLWKMIHLFGIDYQSLSDRLFCRDLN